MISYEVILHTMMQQVEQAKQASTEQQLREQLTAIKVLCDVVLNSASTVSISAPVQSSAIKPNLYSPQPPTQIQSATKLVESDANGDSIFDF